MHSNTKESIDVVLTFAEYNLEYCHEMRLSCLVKLGMDITNASKGGVQCHYTNKNDSFIKKELCTIQKNLSWYLDTEEFNFMVM